MSIDLLESVQVSHVEVLVHLLEGPELVSEAADRAKLANFQLVVPPAPLGLVPVLVDGIEVGGNPVLPQGLVPALVLG